MSIKILNGFLLLLLAIIVGSIVVVQRNYTDRNFEWLPGMFRYVAYTPQSPNSNFIDGTTAQPPVAGTVVRTFEPILYKATPEDAIRAGKELANPLKDDDANRGRGAKVFATVCSPCHGAGGNGDGLIPQHGFPPPPSLFAEHAMKMRDGQMFHIMTFGQKNMPSFASQVLRDDRWRVVTYIRSLQEKKKPTATAGAK